MSTTFFVARRTFRVSANSGMPLWQDRLFIAMSKDAANATDFYSIPTGRVVELGQQITVYPPIRLIAPDRPEMGACTHAEATIGIATVGNKTRPIHPRKTYVRQ